MNLSILNLLLAHNDIHTKYGRFVKECVEQQDSKELKLITSAIDLLHDQYESGTFTVDDLDIMLSKAFPSQPKTLLTPILERMKNEQANKDLVLEYLEDLRIRRAAYGIATQALQVYESGTGIEILNERFSSLSGGVLEGPSSNEEEFVSNDIGAYLTELEQEPGLNWRLKALQDMLGPLRSCFGFVFARPETGKTTMLASECSFMLEQLYKLDKTLLWVNNEEESRKVHSRVVQATLGITTEQLMHNKERCAELFKKKTGNNFRINNAGATNRKEIERWCKNHNPGLIILDQIDKIGGFEAERHDLKMKSIYQWSRELSKEYGPTIGVCQAGGTGENKKWLTMNDVDSSHTAKQGEADFILGIGKLHDEQYERVRFLHASKNKLTGQHSKKEVLINASTARYEDLNRG